MARALIILGHPQANSLSHQLAARYAEGLAGGGVQVELLSLAELSFDLVLRQGFDGQAVEPDLLSARAAIERADHVAWFFPTWWAGPPALVKGFIDRVFLPGWAFQYAPGQSLPRGLLSGRHARVVTSMDSPSLWYRLWHRRAVHASLVNATLKFCGFGPVASTTLFRVRDRSPEVREGWLGELWRLGQRDARRLVAASERRARRRALLAA